MRLTDMRLWMLLCAVGAVLGWWLLPQPFADENQVRARRDAWQVPGWPRQAVDNAALVAISAAPFWGTAKQGAAVGTSAPAAAEDPTWRIAAVFGTSSKRGALITFAATSKQPQRLYVGDKLPSGHVITEIGEREVCVRVGSKSLRLGVERREP